MKTVGKNDGHFHHFHALTPDLVRELDLETVAIRLNGFWVNGLECVAAETFEAASRIGEGHAGDDLHIFRGAGA